MGFRVAQARPVPRRRPPRPDAPGGGRPKPLEINLTALSVEDADRLDRPLVEEVLKSIGRNEKGKEFRPVAGLEWVPEAVRNLAPSNWGVLSVQAKVLAKTYPAAARLVTANEAAKFSADTSNLDVQRTAEEFRNPEARHKFVELRNAFCPIDKSVPDAALTVAQVRENTLHVLQVCRQLSTFTLEGSPFVCNVLVTRGGKVKTEPPRTKGGTAVSCYSCLRPQTQTPFVFSGRLIRAYAELAQSEQMVLVVDADTCQLTEILVVRCNSREHTRRFVLCTLAKATKGLAVHVRGSGLVEVYDEADLQLGYDGFRWTRLPYALLTACLKKFFGVPDEADEADEELMGPVRRVIGGVMSLIDRRASSILVFTTYKGWRRLTTTSETEPHLVHVDPDRVVEPSHGGPTDSRLHVKNEFALDALVGLLHVDGAHVLLNDGGVAGVAYRVVEPVPAGPAGVAAASGTGRAAALALSKRLGGPGWADDDHPKYAPGFVVKVSADRQVHIYWDEHEV